MTDYLTKENFYQPLATGEEVLEPVKPREQSGYPAMRSKTDALLGVRPPKDCVLLRTGGNALQAIERDHLEKKDVVAVIVPWNVSPGQAILVRLPYDNTRMVTAVVPEDMQPGHVFLVQVPEPIVVTGIRVDFQDKAGTRIVPSQEVTPARPLPQASTPIPLENELLLDEVDMANNDENQNDSKAHERNHSIV